MDLRQALAPVALAVIIGLVLAPDQGQAEQNLGVATFAGGCFWCMEPPFEKLPGVVSAVSGYTDGAKQNPTYDEVSSGKTGHAEVVQIIFRPETVGYEALLEVFWRNVDPLQANGQFCDRGSQYRAAIFYHTEEQRQLAEKSKQQIAGQKQFRSPIVTEIKPAVQFYPAEDYHQDYYKKNPEEYTAYRRGCGRDRRLTELWGEQAGDKGKH